jgi:hypothetical protein
MDHHSDVVSLHYTDSQHIDHWMVDQIQDEQATARLYPTKI